MKDLVNKFLDESQMGREIDLNKEGEKKMERCFHYDKFSKIPFSNAKRHSCFDFPNYR